MATFRLILAIGFAVIQCIANAWAASDADAMRQFGLLGAWASKCSAPPSGANPYIIFGASNGKVTRTLQMGDSNLNGIYPVFAVHILTASRIQMAQSDVTGRPATVVMVKENGKLYSLSSQKGNEWLIKDGRFFKSQVPVPRFEKCAGH